MANIINIVNDEDDKKRKRREYLNNYVKNRKKTDEEYRIKLQNKAKNYTKERYKNDEVFREKIKEQGRLRKQRFVEKKRAEKINEYTEKINTFNIETDNMKEYFKMIKYVAKYKAE